MAELTAIPPARRPELLLRPLGEKGACVVKDPQNENYYNLGETEAFLLEQLDGRQTGAAICAAFQQRFGEPLSGDELDEFLKLARAQGFLQAPGSPPVTATALAASSQSTLPPIKKPRKSQSILYWRRSIIDPDRLLNFLAPRLAFLWTGGFLVASLCFIAAAAAVFLQNWQEAVNYFPHSLNWQTIALAYLVVCLATTAHEFGHGLTCKHYGGEVHEMGFLLIFFMPAFYCNVSDAWLIREKYKRIWITLAGGYCDLCVWALAVFVWRVTPSDLSLSSGPAVLHHLAWVTFTVCGMRVFLNFNPLIKLDGYYLLGDWLEITNLRQRSWDFVLAHLRRLLWGAPQPPVPEERPKTLLIYGVCSWLFSVLYLSLLVLALVGLLGRYAGAVGAAGAMLLGLYLMRNMFRGITNGEVYTMILKRYTRTIVWGVLLAAAVTALIVVPMEDRAAGSFQVRPTGRAELRASVSGFLTMAYFDEGDRVSPSSLVATLEVPDLASRTAEKQAEVQEVKAKLRLLEAGARPEELQEQRARLERAHRWAEQGRSDLTRAKNVLEQELVRLDRLVAQAQSELTYARYASERDEKLFKDGTLSQDQWAERKKALEVAEAQLAQGQAQRQTRQTQGTQEAEAELGKREKEEADVRAVLTLLEAGARYEELDAERARLARMQVELAYLEGLQQKLQVTSPINGVVTTPRLKEKVGQYFKEGDLICLIEDPNTLEVEVVLEEQSATRVHPGQTVDLKIRALPFDTFQATVTRVGASAFREKDREHSIVAVYCRMDQPSESLLPGMTGSARIHCGPRSSGTVLLDGAFRYLRTEFWW